MVGSAVVVTTAVGVVTTGALGVVVAFGVAYASIAWLLKFVAGHKLTAFVLYRVVLGLAIAAAVGAGALPAT